MLFIMTACKFAVDAMILVHKFLPFTSMLNARKNLGFDCATCDLHTGMLLDIFEH